jgi:hypothetical protein
MGLGGKRVLKNPLVPQQESKRQQFDLRRSLVGPEGKQEGAEGHD